MQICWKLFKVLLIWLIVSLCIYILRTHCAPSVYSLKGLKYTVQKPCYVSVSFRQFCGRRERSSWPPCVRQRTSGERLVEASRRKVLVEARLENRGENAYGTVLHITHSPNLQFSSLVVKVCVLSPGFTCVCMSVKEGIQAWGERETMIRSNA